jgi:hypothetical protein
VPTLSDGTNTIYTHNTSPNILGYGTSTSGTINIGSASANGVNIGTGSTISFGGGITAPTINTGLSGSGGTINAATVNAALTGNVTGNVSGSSGSCTGNAATATTAGALSGGTVTTGTNSVSTSSGTLTVPVTLSDGTNTIYKYNSGASTMTYAGNTTGAVNIGNTSASSVNITTSSTIKLGGTIAAPTINTGSSGSGGIINAATVNAALTGNVTGNVSGSSGSCTGNAATATTATNFNNGTSSSSGGTVTCNTLVGPQGNYCSITGGGVVNTFGSGNPSKLTGATIAIAATGTTPGSSYVQITDGASNNILSSTYNTNVLLGSNALPIFTQNLYTSFSGVNSVTISPANLSTNYPRCTIEFYCTFANVSQLVLYGLYEPGGGVIFQSTASTGVTTGYNLPSYAAASTTQQFLATDVAGTGIQYPPGCFVKIELFYTGGSYSFGQTSAVFRTSGVGECQCKTFFIYPVNGAFTIFSGTKVIPVLAGSSITAVNMSGGYNISYQ